MDSLTKDFNISLKGGSGIDKYPAKSHARRVAEKLDVRSGVILLFGTETELWPSSDMPRPFRQDRNMYYLSGCNEPGTRVTYEIKKDLLTLWLPQINEDRVVWTGRGSTVEEALEKYDIDQARYIRSMGTDLDIDYAPDEPYCLAEKYCPRIQSQKLRIAINSCRVIKDEHEIKSIRRANKITAKAHHKVMKKLHRFTNEAEVEGAFMNVCISEKAKTQAYDPIAGAGPNAGVLHYAENKAEFGKGQTLVLDAGCEVDLYASDVTRTMPLDLGQPGTWPSMEAQEVYELVEDIQETCIRMLKPGVNFLNVSQKAQQMTIHGLLKLGILKGNPDEIFSHGTHRGFFPHGLGHHLGLDVHDVSPDLHPPLATGEWATSAVPAPEMDVVRPLLEHGMVITIEPGVYFNRYLLDRFFLSDPRQARFIDTEVLERYMTKVGGVRIEDNILITEEGYKNLTTALKGKRMLQYMRKAATKRKSSHE